MNVKRGEVYYADLSPVVGSEQGGYRPVLVVQNDKGNKYSTTVIVAPVSSRMTKNALPTHVYLELEGLSKKSIVLLEQLRTIDKKRLKDKVCHLDSEMLEKVNRAICISLELPTYS